MSVRAQIAIGRLLVAGAWAQNYVRLGLTVFVIALGVALGVAVHTINHSATRELSTAVRSLAGEADISIRSSEAGFDEALYPRLAKRPEVSAASPALEISASLSGRRERLRILVTHDVNLASRCERRLSLASGRLVGDERTAHAKAVAPTLATAR
jgi:ABC-type lipoprotein release transport system permease subunit